LRPTTTASGGSHPRGVPIRARLRATPHVEPGP
jgi:hypothetical protein